MSEEERAVFAAFLGNTDSYVEFGAGGSTVLAASLAKTSVLSVDSTKQWLDQVARACVDEHTSLTPRLLLADIGPTGDWGRPIDDSFKARWPLYSQMMWEVEEANDADLYLIDGRFRLACFLETLLHCRCDSVILIHDFAPRTEYHGVREFAREIITTGDLSAFIRRPAINHERLKVVLEGVRYHPG